MPKVRCLLIKTADPVRNKVVGDVVGIFRETHKFSQDEVDYFDILDIEGIDFLVLDADRMSKQFYRARAFKTDTTEWTNKVEKKDYYIKNGDFYFVEKEPKFEMTLRDMTVQQRKTLESKTATQIEKLNVIQAVFVQTTDLMPENQTKIPNFVEA